MPRKNLLIAIFATILLNILSISGCKSAPEENIVPEAVLTTYETSLFAIQIPETYMGAEPESPGVNAIVAWMSANGHDAQGFSTFIRVNAAEMLYVAVDTEPSLEGSLTYFTLAGSERPKGFSVNEFISIYSQNASRETLLGREQKDFGGKSVEVLMYEFSNGGTTFQNNFYFIEIEEDNQLWKFEFVTPATEYDKKIEDFEKIVTEFTPKDNP